MASRTCIKCDANEADGIAFPNRGNICKPCDAARKAAWYQANRERADSKHAAWAAENPKRAKAIRRKAIIAGTHGTSDGSKPTMLRGMMRGRSKVWPRFWGSWQ